MLFSDKVAIVTGAGQGIGLCVAEHFAKGGASVVIAELNKQTAEPALFVAPPLHPLLHFHNMS